MEENINDQVEAVETEAVDEEDAAFDSGWEDNDIPEATHEVKDTELDDTDAQPESESEGEETEPDTEEAEEPETEADTEAEPETESEAGSQRYNLKFLGEDRKVSFDEMRELAEKGLNYDHVKEERDKLRNYEGFLKELADSGETTIEDLMESTRARLLVQKAAANGEDLSEEEAREQLRSKSKNGTEQTTEDARREAVQRFITLYPNVKSEEIPQSVWDEAERVGDLIGPYQKYESQKLREEIAQLKQNKKNRERSTGSRRTVGATTPKDAFDEGWDS